jgi:cytochrome P450
MDYYAAIELAAGPDRIFWDDDLRAWIITGYQECVALLRNESAARVTVTLPKDRERAELVEFAETVLKSQTMFGSGAGIAERRKFWANVLNGSAASLTSKAPAAIAAEIFESVAPRRPFDLYRAILQPFVSRTICARLGINEAERKRLYPLIMQYASFLDGKLWLKEEMHAAYFAIASLYANLAAPSDRFAAAPSERHETICDYLLNLSAGHESTAYLLGTALLYAGGNSGYLTTAGTDRSLIDRIVREAARFDSPIQLIGRQAQEQISIGNRMIRAGDRLFLHVGAANRDDRVFDHPQMFDPNRSGPPVLTFGLGKTKCIGHSLALEESRAFLATLASTGRRLEIDHAKVTRISGLAGRSFSTLPSRWRALVPVCGSATLLPDRHNYSDEHNGSNNQELLERPPSEKLGRG